MVQFREEISGSIWLSDLTEIATKRGPVQDISYYMSNDFGRVLVINGEVQHVEVWAPFYHEVIAHLPLSFIEIPKYALVLGGGSLFAAEELLKYPSIERVDLVDHDINVIEMTLLAYPERGHLLSDKRLVIIEEKYQEFLPECRRKYDVIVNDCFDLLASTEESGIDYYGLIQGCLSGEGLVSDLVYRSLYCEDHVARALRQIPQSMNRAVSLLAVPEYPGVMHLLTIWGPNKGLSQGRKHSSNFQQENMWRDGSFRVFNPHNLRFYLYSPPYIGRYIR